MGEVECKKADLARNRCLRRLPAEAPSNHQVEDQKRIAFELENDSLAQTARRNNRSAANRIERRLDGTQQKRGREPHVFNRVADNARTKRVQIKLDVREFGHALDSLAACTTRRRPERLSGDTEEAARRDTPRGSGLLRKRGTT